MIVLKNDTSTNLLIDTIISTKSDIKTSELPNNKVVLYGNATIEEEIIQLLNRHNLHKALLKRIINE